MKKKQLAWLLIFAITFTSMDTTVMFGEAENDTYEDIIVEDFLEEDYEDTSLNATALYDLSDVDVDTVDDEWSQATDDFIVDDADEDMDIVDEEPSLLLANSERYGDFEYTLSDNEATITSYCGTDAEVVVPNRINGVYPVTSIGGYAFSFASYAKK